MIDEPGATTAASTTDAANNDPRFTFGLVLDVARVIEAHGYPEHDGCDLVRVMEALFTLLYRR